VFISPDAGGVERTRAYAKRMDVDIAIVDKRRERANVSEVMNVIGDIEGRDCVILDDMIDTAGTLTNAAKALKEKGARSVSAAATHAVLSGPAVERIANSAKSCGKFKVLGVSKLLGEAIKRIHNGDSVSSLFV
jgi:ribose-phosphate pyrophosphokinase